jgi:Zn-finger nucleic acid-binding protein
MGVSMSVCPSCKGVWLEHDDVIAYMKEHLAKEGLPSKMVGLLETPPVPAGLHCPSCSDEALHLLKLRGVEVEQCGKCRGTFFDVGELGGIAKRLGFATKDTKAIDDKRKASSRNTDLGRDVERVMGDAVEAAVWGFEVDF